MAVTNEVVVTVRMDFGPLIVALRELADTLEAARPAPVVDAAPA